MVWVVLTLLRSGRGVGPALSLLIGHLLQRLEPRQCGHRIGNGIRRTDGLCVALESEGAGCSSSGSLVSIFVFSMRAYGNGAGKVRRIFSG